jgi:hypothetical protein
MDQGNREGDGGSHTRAQAVTQKIVTKLSKIWVWDPGAEIRDPEKAYSGSRIQGSKMHRIPDPDPQHCFECRDTIDIYLVVILRVSVVAFAIGEVAAIGETHEVPVDPLEDLVDSVKVPPLRVALALVGAVTE